ncbi:hypothetical protein CC78DRAFT_553953 [Lojkania enalia]|uniref:GH16 domain-containing protein n=1 Tax=Lojkania enalia TaxID=147567 RepID=A0A9P4KCL9_9PLEO|nr:hypothetical protein CC78DRAFT_553953 [Didymosphaeria enalia]
MFYLQCLIFFLVSSFNVAANVLNAEQKNCSCGYYDTGTENFFTDSIIVYFNETNSLPDTFLAEDYEHKYEKDWNAIYRQGADPANVRFNKSGSLQLFLSPPTKHHLVKGGSIRTRRRDIHHGSFRTFIKSPRRTLPGSAMSMIWQYNETETTELSIMNTNNPSRAWVGTFVNGEFTTRNLGVNFTNALNNSTANRNYTTLSGFLGNGNVDLWEYAEYRMDWTKDYINFYVGGNLTRSVLHKDNKGMPSVPSPFYFKHWSTGNRFSMEGPPNRESVANIGWIRMFFNSSSMTKDARDKFRGRCLLTEACSMNDITLRGSTPYAAQATKKWKQAKSEDPKRMPAVWISVICISLSTFLLVHAFIRRAPWKRKSGPTIHGHPPVSAVESSGPPKNPESNPIQDSNSPFEDPKNPFETPEHVLTSQDSLTLVHPSPGTSVYTGSTPDGPSRTASIRFDSGGTTPCVISPYSSNFNNTLEELHSKGAYTAKHGNAASKNSSGQTNTTFDAQSALPPPRMTAHPPSPRQRVDYLAGLVAMCSILVTVMHFGLTFVPAMIIPGAHEHHQSEHWAQQLIAPFILNQMWLGVFFTTSVRFLVAGYLKNGNMESIAKAAVRRTPRLMIPVTTVALFEYFVIDVGATTYLRYIPSITWSTWPYVTRFETIGHFISGILELIYLIPNAVPQITFNYCTGVLWTIAVQLQGSWLVLIGVIIVYEVKSPWKRMGFYVFALINHWYAQSWGSYLWFGLLLTDLDITYKYKEWLHKRPFAYYPLILSCWICVAAGFAANMIPNWIDFNFLTYENNIHPDPNTGEPYWNTDKAGYPEYYTPRLNGLLFAAGMQAIVELSPTVQWVLSLPFLLVLFPHIFTIYLLHGLVFWSWGSWLMIFMADRNIGYSISVAIVGVTSYMLLFLILPIVTPIIEALGKDTTALVWMTATEKSPPRRRTLFPFPDDLFARREHGDAAGGVARATRER